MSEKLQQFLDDLLILAGCALVLVFVFQVWPVGTWLVGGLMLIVFGVLIGLGGRHDDHP